MSSSAGAPGAELGGFTTRLLVEWCYCHLPVHPTFLGATACAAHTTRRRPQWTVDLETVHTHWRKPFTHLGDFLVIRDEDFRGGSTVLLGGGSG